MILNPYTQQPVIGTDFAGRQAEIRRLQGRIVESVRPQHCAIVGETGIGRTSLLRTFLKDAVSVRQDLLVYDHKLNAPLERKGSTNDFYRQLFLSLAADLIKYEVVRDEASRLLDVGQSPVLLFARARDLFRRLHATGSWLLLALDGFDSTVGHFDFQFGDWGLLRELGENEDYGLCYLFSSRIPISQLEQDTGIRSNLASLFAETVRLQVLSQEEAGSLIDQPMQRQGQSWPHWLRQLILRLCGGHPKLLQITCFALFQYYANDDLTSVGDEERLMAALQSQYQEFFKEQARSLQHRQLFDVLLKLATGVPVDASGGQIDELNALGYLLPVKDFPDHFRPFGELQHLYLQICGRQQKGWPVVEQTKEALQDLVEERYRTAFGSAWPVLADRYPSGTEHYDWAALPARWRQSWQRLQYQPFVSLPPMNRLICFAPIADLWHLIELHRELFADIFPRLQQTLRVLQSSSEPEALYRRMREDEAGRVEQNCRDVLAALAPSLAAGRAVTAHLQVGDCLEGHYEIEQILDPTGHSQVVRARDIHLGTTVAIKFLSSDLATDSTLQDLHLQMPGREGQIIGRLMHRIHPNIGIVLTFLPASHAIVKPWVERSAPSFEAMLADDAFQIPALWLVALGIKVTDALHYVHTQGIVHRDIKPGNILLNMEDDPILIDFDIASAPGISALWPDSAGLPGEMGTPWYSAPEQLEHPAEADSPADLFALGVVFYQALTHTFPYPYGNRPDLYPDGHLPAPKRRNIPEPLYQLICAMISERAEKRPAAGEVCEQLRAYQATLSMEQRRGSIQNVIDRHVTFCTGADYDTSGSNAELATLQFLLDRLDPALVGEYQILVNYNIPRQGADLREIDLLVITRYGIFLLEVKGWLGQIVADDRGWYVDGVYRSNVPVTLKRKVSILSSRFLQHDSRLPDIRTLSATGFVVLTRGLKHFQNKGNSDTCALFDLKTPRLIDALSSSAQTFHGPHSRSLGDEEIAYLRATIYKEHERHAVMIGKYRRLKEISTSELFVAYEAENSEIRRRVRLKRYVMPVLSPDRISVLKHQFQRSTTAVWPLNACPQIVQTHDFFSAPDEGPHVFYEVTELLDGVRLDEIMAAARQQLPCEEQLRYLESVGQALQAAHAHEIYHRNLCPQVIFVAKDGTIKVGDFDFAKLPGQRTVFARGGIQPIWRIYTSPEMRYAPSAAGAVSDIYSLGVLWFALARLPEQESVFEPEHPGQAIAHLPLPHEARVLMERMMAFAPEHRLATMEEVLAGFKGVRAASS